MQVILKKEVLGLGDPGELVEVRRGYARNYLVPQGLALEATKNNMATLDAERKRILAQQAKEAQIVRAEAAGLSGVSVTIQVRAGETGKLYGSVSTKEIAAALAEAGHEIDRRRIVLENPLKELGRYPVKVKLHPQVVVEINVTVEASSAKDDTAKETDEVDTDAAE